MVELGLIPRDFSFQEWNQNYEGLIHQFRYTQHLRQRQLEELYHFLIDVTGQIITQRHPLAAGAQA